MKVARSSVLPQTHPPDSGDLPRHRSLLYRADDPVWIVELLEANGLVSSRGEARRLIEQGAVSFDGDRVEDQMFQVPADGEHILKVGKRRFLKVITS